MYRMYYTLKESFGIIGSRFFSIALSELCVGFLPQSEGILGVLIRQEGARWSIASFCGGSMNWLRN